MARKDRTPPPPRKVQAPRVRQAPRQGPDRRRVLLLAIVGAIALAVVAGAVAAVIALGGGSSSARAALTDAGCEVRFFPAQAGRHVDAVPEGFEYNSDPPTSGPHDAVPATFDVYDEPVDPLHALHNLEHGGVVIQYGDDVPESDVTAIVDWYRDDPNGLIVAPRPANGDEITLSAWLADGPEGEPESEHGTGVLARCASFDEAAFDAFKDEYGFKGPEPFPRDQLAPGTFGG